MAERYRGQVEFILVYVQEAHPTDGWQLPQNERTGALLPTAQSLDQKTEHATICVRKLDITFTTVVDGMDNAVENAYAGWPDRLYLIDKDGRIAWKGRPGPEGFRPLDLEQAIERELTQAVR